MEGIGESMLVIGRVCTIIPLLLLVTLFMGKRSIGELPVFDFIIIITLGSVAGADIAELTWQRLIWPLSRRTVG
ncbi:hypothetical protein [Brevibacillus porteri]|uniref:hypothetical protein n=1 Tax=Brevibacillus porteri TaxID=2126350 RepID=UPI00362501DA